MSQHTFISYSRKDYEFAKHLYDGLQGKGIRCWLDDVDLRIGDRFRDVIEDAIRLHEKLLLVLSENSVTSDWVEDEVEAAFEKERKLAEQRTDDDEAQGQKPTVLFPVRIDDTVEDTSASWARKIHRTRQVGDFTGWKNHDAYQKAFDRLIRDLKRQRLREQEQKE